ncbi:MAG: PTS sugar transporter subunit IIA [Verrucomicrobiales bacterium]|nr:PTS sugar transporter subunit IIA [Verrucomicrobiales bacterium]
MFLNVIQLAESLGVEENVVEGWIRNEGLPHVTDRGRLLFDRTQVVNWAESHGLAAKVGFLAPERSKIQGGKKLETMLRTGGIWRDVPAANVLNLFADIVAKLPGATPSVHQMLQQRLRAPNGISWALVGGGLALPHLRTPIALGRDAGIFAIVLLRDALAVKEPAPDEQAITRLLFFVAPSPRAHLELLAQLSTALSRGNLRKLINESVSDDEIFAAVAATETGGKKEGDA